ncbi:uncharacterized protein [Epargyreus clarus]|uniref:uncharacterized protein n=1 Tax=Epargyreus clarus TaxID=520877 RepID=UPI003C2E1EC3
MAQKSGSESIASTAISPARNISVAAIAAIIKMEEESILQILKEESEPMPEDPIDVDILNALGNKEKIPKAPIAHTEIANQWKPILAKGLPKDVKLELMSKHIPFENIPTITPKLNPEIIAAVTDPVKRRDAIIAERQTQVGAALAAIGKSLQLLLQKGDNIEIFKNINDAAKIMCDTIYTDTKSRRSLITSVINKDMTEALTGDADSLLFGSDLPKRIRATKSIQRSVKYLKKAKKAAKTRSLDSQSPSRSHTREPAGRIPNQSGKQQWKEQQWKEQQQKEQQRKEQQWKEQQWKKQQWKEQQWKENRKQRQYFHNNRDNSYQH